jgi:hypothetical protein
MQEVSPLQEQQQLHLHYLDLPVVEEQQLLQDLLDLYAVKEQQGYCYLQEVDLHQVDHFHPAHTSCHNHLYP